MSIGGSRKLLTFLVCGQIATAGLVFGESDQFEQPRRVSAGIKIGAPLTEFLKTDISGNSIQTKPYTFGPVIDVYLLRGVGIEVSAMYKRIDQQATANNILGYVVIDEENSYAITEHYRVSAVGQSWEFPIALQYHFPLSSIRPYVEIGRSYSQLTNILGYIRFVPGGVIGPMEPAHDRVNRHGLLVGAGAEIKQHFIHMTPGVRFTRYSRGEGYLLNTNSAEFLVGFKF
jgi:hypothetical protein